VEGRAVQCLVLELLVDRAEQRVRRGCQLVLVPGRQRDVEPREGDDRRRAGTVGGREYGAGSRDVSQRNGPRERVGDARNRDLVVVEARQCAVAQGGELDAPARVGGTAVEGQGGRADQDVCPRLPWGAGEQDGRQGRPRAPCRDTHWLALVG